MSSTISGTLTTAQQEYLSQLDSSSSTNSYEDSQTLDKDAFLNLMLVQLQNQDPLSPMDNSQMIAQMSDFSMVEQMTNMASSMEDSNSLVSLLSVQLDDILSQMQSSGTNSSDLLDQQSAIKEQNDAILEALLKTNEMLNAYFDSQEDDTATTAEELLSAL
ncbi:MAG: flagellar basal-body rod modification protein FlgD [Clostridiales bacterium]|jgi:flagellar hook assembly protein FlgD|nr:flagellar basal-body rod modification protein FlgD [Clostridiales bacterium]